MADSEASHWPRVIVLWLCGVFAAMQFSKISIAFAALRDFYAVAPASMGLVLSAVGVVGLVFGVTVGLIAPAIGYRRLLLAGLGLGAVLSLLQSLMLPYPLLLASRVLEGASHLAVVVAAPTLMAASCAPRHRSIAMGLWSTFVGVAFAVTGAFGAAAIDRYRVSGLFGLHASALAFMFVVTWIALRKLGEPARASQRPRLADLPRHHLMIYTELSTALPGLCFFCYTVMAVALLTFLPQYAGDDRHWVAVFLPLMGIFGAFCVGWLAHFRLSPLLLVRLAFAAVGLAGLALGLCFVIGAGIGVAAMLLLFCAGMSGGASFALIPYLSDSSVQHARANGAVAQMGNLGSTTGPPLFAALAAPLGLFGLVLPVLLFALAGIGVAALGARHRLRRPVAP